MSFSFTVFEKEIIGDGSEPVSSVVTKKISELPDGNDKQDALFLSEIISDAIIVMAEKNGRFSSAYISGTTSIINAHFSISVSYKPVDNDKETKVSDLP